MSSSIENIWKTGFTNEILEVPKIHQLYNQKSISTVERTIKRFKREVLFLLPLSLFTFLFNIFLDNSNAVFWGLISAIPCLIWFFIGRKQLKELSNIDYKANCYDYLISLQSKLRSISTFNKRLAITSIPVTLFPMLVYTYFKQRGKTIGEIFGVDGMDFPTITIFLLIPLLTLVAYIVATIAFKRMKSTSALSIDALIQEMEELKS